MPARFLVDFMLGKLARELRMLGFDTHYLSYDKLQNRNPLEIIKIALKEQRILLTRNQKLKNYPQVFFIESDKTSHQVTAVLNHFQLRAYAQPGSRCLECNDLLQPASKENLKGKVPYYIYKTQNEFYRCPTCQKIYWPGTHYTDMKKRIEKYLS
jgi:uncharacterized protein with PIN domain